MLFLGRDNFVSWELIGSEVYAPITNHYDVEEVPALYRATDLNAKFDWDNVPPPVMNRFDWVVTTSAAMQSQAPVGFRPRLRTHDFVLWHRDHPVGQRRTLFEPINPGAPLDCSDPGEAKLRKIDGTATVFTVQPVVGRVWRPSPELTQTKPAQQRLYLTPGRWDISIQYASTQALHVTGSGGPLAAPFDATLRTNLLFRGPSPYYPVGTLEVKRPGEVVFDVSVDDPPLVGRLLHTESKAYLTGLAATRADPPRQPVLSPGLRPLRGLVRGRARHPTERAPGRAGPASPAGGGRLVVTFGTYGGAEGDTEPRITTIAACPASGPSAS